MTFILEAPHPALATASYLPNPQLGDSIGATGTLDIKRSMNGIKYSYIKSRDQRKRFLWTFAISYNKALELQAFFTVYLGDKIRVTDHFGRVYIGNFITNPFEFEGVGRSVTSPGDNTLYQIQLEFQGFEQTP